MASLILPIYDAIADQIELTLGAGYRRLPNPYVVESTTYLTLEKGYGLAIGPGEDTERYVGCLVTWRQGFTIILIRQAVATQNDLDRRVIIEKDILDTRDQLRKAFYSNSTLGGIAIKTSVTGSGDVVFVDAERKFFTMQLDLVTEYQEDLNS